MTDSYASIETEVGRGDSARTTPVAEDRRLGRLRVHVALPSTASTSGVLLYPTITGLTQSMRDFADAFARDGHAAVVWDPYDGEDGSGDIPEMVAKSARCEDNAVVSDLREIVDYMRDELRLGSLAAIGWCFGGRIGLLHAGSDDRIGMLSAYNPTIWSQTPVVIDGIARSRADFPGQTMDEFALASAIAGPVQVSQPEHDFTQQAEYDRLLQALRDRPWPTSYEYHPGADHGFSYTPGEANQRAHRFAWTATLSLLRTSFATEEGASSDS